MVELIIGAALFLSGCLLTLWFTNNSGKNLRGHLSEMAERQNALQGRLSQFSEDVAQRDASMRDTLDNRLSQVSEKVGQSIVETQERNSERDALMRDTLDNRLSQVSEKVGQAIVETQERNSERDALMRDTLDNRLSQVSEKVGQSIVETQERNSESLKQLHERLAVIDRAQKNIETLSGEVSGLQNILSNKQARGAFGEKQMQDLISEYLPPQSFEFQVTLSNRKRVDALIHLPNEQGAVAVDSKFPMESWRRLVKLETVDKKRAQQDFSRDVKAHITDIALKYLILGETHDVALMFIPSEAIYAELHANFSEVIEEGFGKRVMIVSPTTFMATLHTMRAVMKDAAMREQAHIIQREVGEIAKDVNRLDDRVAKLQQHFNQSTEDVRQIRISTEKISKRADKIEALDMEEQAPANIA